MSLSTLDRWIAAGEVQVEREKHGKRHRVYVVLNAAMPDTSGDAADGGSARSNASGDSALALAEERVRHLEDLVDYLKAQLGSGATSQRGAGRRSAVRPPGAAGGPRACVVEVLDAGSLAAPRSCPWQCGVFT